jgi:sugar phosphate permease
MARPPVTTRFHYAWVIVAVTLLALVMSAGFRSTLGVLIRPLEDEFGWSRSAISFAIALNLGLFGLVGPFSAALMARFGIRRVMLVALAVVASASALTTVMDHVWQLALLWGVVMGLATGSLSVPLAAIVANNWFTRRRGLAVGVMGAASATGALVFLPGIAALAAAAGWRYASWTVTLTAALLVMPLVALFMRDRPADVGLRPFGASADDPAPPPLPNPLNAAIRGLVMGLHSRSFWYLAGSFFVCGLTTNGLVATHFLPAAHDHGIGSVTAAGLLAAIGAFDIVGTIASGFLTDRFDSRWLLFWYYGLRGLSLLLLPVVFGSSDAGLLVFVVFYGLDWVATVPPTVALTASTFGRENVGILFGWVFAAHQLGGATAAVGAGVLRDWLGSYTVAFLAAGALAVLTALLVLRIKPGPTPDLARPHVEPGTRAAAEAAM